MVRPQLSLSITLARLTRIQKDGVCEHRSSGLKDVVQIGGKSIVLEILKAQLLSHVCLGWGNSFPY